jgi:hypothetical protein
MTTLTFSNRYFQLTRSFAIKNWQDGLIEILTNSTDAYARVPGSESVDEKPVKITLSNDRRRISVLDNGVGMTTTDAMYNLLNVGTANTDSSQTRGYFNRGAKDVTAVGVVSFTCLKNEDWCKVTINPDLTATVLSKNEISEDAIRNIFGSSQSGVRVDLDLLEIHAISQALKLSEVGSLITNLFQLRSIMSSKKYKFTLTEGEETIDLTYVHRKSTLVDKIVYKVPGYEEVEATFQLFMTDSELPVPLDRRVQQNGILLRSSRTDYDVTFFDESFRYNRYSKYFYGFLTTEGVSIMLRDFEEKGASNKNPQLILNPSRGNVNLDHPFIRQLFSVPKLRLKTVLDLREMEDSTSTGRGKQSDPTHMVLNNVENVANNIIRSIVPNYFVHTERVKQIALAFKDVRDNYEVAALNLHEEIDVTNPNAADYGIPDTDVQIERIYSQEAEGKDMASVVQWGELKDAGDDVPMGVLDRYVNAQIDSSVRIKIDFVDLSDPSEQYKVINGNYVIYIKINLSNPIIKTTFEYDADSGVVKGVDTPLGQVHLMDIVSDVISWLYIEENSKQNTEREYSLLDGVLHGKSLYSSKRADIKMEMMNGIKIE